MKRRRRSVEKRNRQRLGRSLETACDHVLEVFDGSLEVPHPPHDPARKDVPPMTPGPQPWARRAVRRGRDIPWDRPDDER
jgi:hypothetical protein